MSIWNTFDDTFWLTLAGIIVGVLGVLIRYCFLSKCDNVSICFGLLKIHRAVELELPNVEDDQLEEQYHENEEKENVPKNS
jgi:hypothetical protein